MEKENYKEESIIKKAINSEAKYFVGILFFGLGIIRPYFQIVQQLSVIDIKLQTIVDNITEIKANQSKLSEVQIAQSVDITDLQKHQISQDSNISILQRQNLIYKQQN